MVKNTTGGKHKFASKQKTGPSRLREAQHEDEMYAVVSNVNPGHATVLGSDGVSRTCFYRGNFGGKGKRDNFVRKNSIILMGLRSYETKKDKADLLEVYTPQEVTSLRGIDPELWVKLFKRWAPILGDQEVGAQVEFEDNDEEVAFDDI
jgi:hypothetical protein